MNPLSSVGILIVATMGPAVTRGGEALWDQTASIKRPVTPDPKDRATWVSVAYTNLEVADDPDSTNYLLSGIVVPPGGWVVDAITACFERPQRPDGWDHVTRGRLNIIRRVGGAELPGQVADPRKGRLVGVEVRRGEVYEVRASGLGLRLDPGEYWIGLTPIGTRASGGQFNQLRTDGHRGGRIEPVAWNPNGSYGLLRPGEWATLMAGALAPLDEDLAIRIEGQRIARGREIEVERPGIGSGDARLHLRLATFDPLAGPPEVPPGLEAEPEGRIAIVQLESSPDQRAWDRLTREGATPLRYLPDDAYVVEMDPARHAAVAALPGVRWVGPFHPAYRIDPSLDGKPDDPAVPGDYLDRPVRCLIQVFRGGAEGKRAVVREIERIGGTMHMASPHGYLVVATLSRDQVRAVARLDQVAYVELDEDDLTSFGPPGRREVRPDPAAVSTSDVRAMYGADFAEEIGGYLGQGICLSVIDIGDVRSDHVDLASRPVIFASPRPESVAFHATAVVGVLCGDGTGNPRARGLAPRAQAIYSHHRVGRTDRYALTHAALADPHHAILQSDSSGGAACGSYKYLAMEVDDIVLESDITICEAMGNTGGRSASGGGWAKNVVSIGGIAHSGSLDRLDHRHWPMSSRGPTDDGRIKPDLAHFADGVFGVDAASRRSYATFGGTSCAAPLTSGHFALMFQMWADGIFGNWPRHRTAFDCRPHAATAKALIINSASPYEFSGPGDEFSRGRQGWGTADLRRLYQSRGKLFVIDEEDALTGGRAMVYRLRVGEGERAFRATLAYTDPPGATFAAKALVNDLDLTITSPGGITYLGNHGPEEGNWSRPGGDPDARNNVENVFVEEPEGGVWTVEVSARRIALDQHAETPEFDSNFALVVSGVAPESMPAEGAGPGVERAERDSTGDAP